MKTPGEASAGSARGGASGARRPPGAHRRPPGLDRTGRTKARGAHLRGRRGRGPGAGGRRRGLGPDAHPEAGRRHRRRRSTRFATRSQPWSSPPLRPPQEDVQGLDRRLTELEDEVNRLSTGQTTTRRELKVVQDDIKELRDQVSSASGSSSGTQLVRTRPAGTPARPAAALTRLSGIPSLASHVVLIRTRRACTRPASPLRSHARHTHAVPERRSHRCQPVTA